MEQRTLLEWIVYFGGICGAIVTISGLLTLARKPFKSQAERLDKLEREIGGLRKDMETAQKDLNHAFDKERDLEATSRTTERALLALLNHSLYGNNTKEMEEVKKDLEAHIWKGDNS